MRLLHGVAYKSRPLFHIHLQTFGKRLLCLTANTHTHLNTHSRHQKRTYSTNTNIQLKHFWAPATHTWKGDDNGDRATSAHQTRDENSPSHVAAAAAISWRLRPIFTVWICAWAIRSRIFHLHPPFGTPNHRIAHHIRAENTQRPNKHVARNRTKKNK